MAEGEGQRKDGCGGVKKPENLGDLLRNGTVKNVQDLEKKIKSIDLELFDECLKWSITPLMVACVLGYKDVVKYLLEKGANPNQKCTEEMNTPLHYACVQREYIEDNFLSSKNYWHFECAKEDCKSRKQEIIQLLLDHGAILERNTLGFLPIHCAALFAMENIVDYFITKDLPVPLADADKLMAMEILGVSQSVILDQCSQAYFTFVSALLIRHDIGHELSLSSPTELGRHLNCNECTSFDELHKLKHDESAMFIQGLLVGERILPEKLKRRYLWTNMMYPSYELDKFICVCQYGLELEMSSRLEVGSVLEGIRELLMGDIPSESLPETLFIQISSCIETYKEILQVVESEKILDQAPSLSSSLSYILNELLIWQYSRQSFDLLFKTIIGVVKVYSEQTSAYEGTSCVSVLQNLFDIVITNTCEFLGRKKMRSFLVLLLHVLSLLLKYDHKLHTDNVTAHNMLQMAMQLLTYEHNFDIIVALTHKLVRHGCPIEAKTYNCGETAKEFALRLSADFEIDHPEFEEIVALVSRPSEALSLQELTARCVLQNKISYDLGTVPSTVYDFLNGEDFFGSIHEALKD